MKKILWAVSLFLLVQLSVPVWANLLVTEYIVQGQELLTPAQAEQSAAILQQIEQDYQVKISFFIHSWDGKSSLDPVMQSDQELFYGYNNRGRRAMFILTFGPAACEMLFNMRPENLFNHDQMAALTNLIGTYPLSNTIKGVSTNFIIKLDTFIREELFLSPWDKFLHENNRNIGAFLRDTGFLVFMLLILAAAILLIILTVRSFKRFPFLILFLIPVIILQIYRIIPDFLAVIAYTLIFGFELFNNRTVHKDDKD
ncbi:MAG: hypothetical protein A2014_08595 [Spirochaetes bacterium GWF1_49_6]|nr:MAG: hypothetical protein A2014_08595 [Spirochaetes bacterium GWF1_49_6]